VHVSPIDFFTESINEDTITKSYNEGLYKRCFFAHDTRGLHDYSLIVLKSD